MLDHITLRVSDYAKSRAFYVAALAPLAYSVMAEFEHDEVGDVDDRRDRPQSAAPQSFFQP